MSTAENPNVDFNPDALVTSIKVEIDAPASLVWDILIDMPKYGEWNPFCIECDSTLEMGAPVNMKLKSYITPDEVFDNCEFICAFEPEKMISWELPYSPITNPCGERARNRQSLRRAIMYTRYGS